VRLVFETLDALINGEKPAWEKYVVRCPEAMSYLNRE
jgi:hypothetical protein